MNRRTECKGMQERLIGFLKHCPEELNLISEGGKFAATKIKAEET